MAIGVQENNESQIGLALFSKQHGNKTNNDSPTFNSSGSPPSTDAIIIIDDDDEEEKVTLESKKRKRSPPSTDAIITIDDDDEEEKVTLEPKQRKRRLGSWWENVEPFDELICVVNRPRNNGVDESRANSCFTSTDLNETKTNEKNDDERSLPKKKNDEIVGEISTTTRKKKKDYEHVTLEDLEVSIEDLKSIPWESFDTKTNDDEGSLPKKKNDEIVGEISTSTRKKKKDYEHVTLEDLEVSMEDLKSIPWESFDTKTNDDEGSLPKKKNDDEIVGEISTRTRNKKDYEHVTLEDLEVSMEDLKNIPWESFDTTWEIKSDPWLGGYTEDQLVSL